MPCLAALLAVLATPLLHGADAGGCDAAREALRAGRAADASAAFAVVLAAHPDADCAVEGRVRALLALDRWPEALAEARALRARLPASRSARGALGEALVRAGGLAEAEDLLAAADEDDAAGGSELSLLGMLRDAAGRADEAAALMERALEKDPDDPRVILRAADASPGRSATIALLERYLERSAGEDPDRVEAARGTLATLRELGDRPVWVLEQAPERVEIPLQLIGHEGRVVGAVIRVEIGEPPRTVRLLLDTGSPGLFVTSRLAEKRGFVPLARETSFGGGGDQRHEASRGRFGRLAVSGLVYRDALATSAEHEFDATGRYHGVLGIGIFEGYRIEIDLRRGRLVLDRAPAGEGGSRFWTVSGQMLVEARAVGARPGLFLFDTGASVSVLDLSYARQIKGVDLRQLASLSGYGGALAEARVAVGARVELGSVDSGSAALRAADFSVRSRIAGVQLCGFVGLDVLGGRRWLVDWAGRTVRELD